MYGGGSMNGCSLFIILNMIYRDVYMSETDKERWGWLAVCVSVIEYNK